MVATILFALAASVPAAPPLVSIPASPLAQVSAASLALWMPGAVSCETGGQAAPTLLRRPHSTLVWGEGRMLKPITLTFDIDGAGRPLSIAREQGFVGVREDRTAPALAASSFAAGPARQGCKITYTPDIQSLERVARAEIASYVITRQIPTLPPAAFARLREGDGCERDRRTQPLIRAYPDFARVQATPGVRDWTVIGFDVDAAGRPANVRALASTGNAALDSAASESIRKSRFNKGPARTGCSYPYWRNAGVRAAPPMGDKPPPGTAGCAIERWATAPRLIYPPAYVARAIEGWAVLRFDVAPWGEIGNVRVIEAQPSEDFGLAARAMLELARKPTGAAGTDCMTRVVYKMSDGDGGGVDMPETANN